MNRYALVIGIDDYPAGYALTGSVNDADAMERLLIDSGAFLPEHVVKLTAPRAASSKGTKPTLGTITSALEQLGGPEIQPGDRILVFYSGHGVREIAGLDGSKLAREAIVPVDAWETDDGRVQVLWDADLNRMLRKIVARGAQLTCIFDRCHSAGLGRSGSPLSSSEVLGLVRGIELTATSFAPRLQESTSAEPQATSSPSWAMISACEAFELARELRTDPPRGAFTHALLRALEGQNAVARDEARGIAALRWCDVWPELVENLRTTNPAQHVRGTRFWTRPLFGGSETGGEPGFVVRQTGAHYEIGAGELYGLVVGVDVGIYGPDPQIFPRVGSPEDDAARVGVVRIRESNRLKAIGTALGPSFTLPAGARARPIAAPRAARLSVRIAPEDGTAIRIVGASSLLRIAEVGAPGEVWLKALPQDALPEDRYVVGDDLYDAIDPSDPRHLLSFRRSEASVKAVLEHYARYSAPLRMARHPLTSPGLVEVDLFAAAKGSHAEGGELSLDDLPRVSLRKTPDGVPRLADEAEFFVSVENRHSRELVVALLCCTSDGTVEWMGEHSVPAGGRKVWWRDDKPGQAFQAALSGQRIGVYERIVALGTTAGGSSFASFAVDKSFDEVIDEAARDFAKPVSVASLSGDDWTGSIVPFFIGQLNHEVEPEKS